MLRKCHIVNRMAIIKRFIINMILFIKVFAYCSIGGSAHYIAQVFYVGLIKCDELVIYHKYVLKQFKAIDWLNWYVTFYK